MYCSYSNPKYLVQFRSKTARIKAKSAYIFTLTLNLLKGTYSMSISALNYKYKLYLECKNDFLY